MPVPRTRPAVELPYKDQAKAGLLAFIREEPAMDEGSDDGDSEGRAPRHKIERQEELLDEALEETFPASDPIAPARIGDQNRRTAAKP